MNAQVESASFAIPAVEVNSSFSWPNVNMPGLAPIGSLRGDPGQPRKFFSLPELRLLAKEIKKSGQRDVITVREFTPDERASLPPGVRYQIVGGERRWRAAIMAGLTMVMVIVKSYKTRAEQRLDGWHLNENRVNLSDWENALFVKEAAVENGWETQEEIAEGLGKNIFWVSTRLKLFELHPDVQARMKPEIPAKQRFKIPTAMFLSRQSLEHQSQLVRELPSDILTSGAQASWFKKRLIELGVMVKVRTRRPSNYRESLEYLARTVTEQVDRIADEGGYKKVFENATPDQIERVVQAVDNAFEKLESLTKQVKSLHSLQAGSAARATDSVSGNGVVKRGLDSSAGRVQGFGKEQPRPPQPAAVPAPSARPMSRPPEPKAAVPPSGPSRLSDVPWKQAERPASKPKETPKPISTPQDRTWPRVRIGTVVLPPPSLPTNGGGEVTVQYFDSSSGRIVLNKVSMTRYVMLWDAGELKFQEGWLGADAKPKPKPESWPTREEAIAKITNA